MDYFELGAMVISLILSFFNFCLLLFRFKSFLIPFVERTSVLIILSSKNKNAYKRGNYREKIEIYTIDWVGPKTDFVVLKCKNRFNTNLRYAFLLSN
jgi:hypothetical protein